MLLTRLGVYVVIVACVLAVSVYFLHVATRFGASIVPVTFVLMVLVSFLHIANNVQCKYANAANV